MHDAPTQNINESPTGIKLRFSIVHLFYTIALLTSGFVVLGWWSICVSGLALGLWAMLYSREVCVLGCYAIIAIIIILIMIAVSVPSVQAVRDAEPRFACMNNMRQLILATLNYEWEHKTLPPAVSLDKNGEPMHSWRALVIPFLGGPRTYRLSEPWNGPNNRKLSGTVDYCLQCPSTGLTTGQTTYKFVTGEGSAFPIDGAAMQSELADGNSNTIVMIEDVENPINWLEPKDITIEEATKALTSSQMLHKHKRETLFKTTYYGVNVAFMDGSTQTIRPNADPEMIRRALIIDDGQPVDLDSITGEYVVHKPSGYVAFAIYFASLVFPAYLLWKKQSQRKVTKANN